MLKWIKCNIQDINWSQITIVTLMLVTMGFMIWALNEIGQRSCRLTSAPFNESAPCPSLLEDISILFVIVGFLLVSIVVWWTEHQLLPAIYFLVIASILATGIVTLDNSLASRVFNILLAFFIPLTLHFHLYLLQRPIQSYRKYFLISFYGLAVLISLPFILWPIATQEVFGIRGILRDAVRSTLLLVFLIVILIFLYEYREHGSLTAKGKIRLISFGTIFAFTPMLLLSVLPEVLSGIVNVPYAVTFPGLLFSPLTYIYSSLRHKFTKFEGLVNRIVLYYMLVILLAGIYLIALSLLNRTSATTTQLSTTSVALNVLLLLSLPIVHMSLQHLINWVMYGGEINYPQIQEELSEAFSLVLDRNTLKQLLLHELPKRIHLNGAILFLHNKRNELHFAGAVGVSLTEQKTVPKLINCSIIAFLEKESSPVPVRTLVGAFALELCESTERFLLSLDKISYWVPLISAGTLQGVLLLSDRRRGELLTLNDEHLLKTLAHSAGIAAYNVLLIEEAAQHQRDLAKAHKQLLINREQDQRRIARELHDSAIQQIIGLNFQFNTLRSKINQDQERANKTIDNIRAELSAVLTELRRVISELRPAGLTEIGLTHALEGYIARLKQMNPRELPTIHSKIDEDLLDLPEPISICLFRVAQEAIQNIIKHADATTITLNLQKDEDKVLLTLKDNGIGFKLPSQLSELAQNGHFGLVGMDERVQWAQGTFLIESTPGLGTRIEVAIPIRKNKAKL